MDSGLLSGVLALLVLQTEVEASATHNGEGDDRPADDGRGEGLVGLGDRVNGSEPFMISLMVLVGWVGKAGNRF